MMNDSNNAAAKTLFWTRRLVHYASHGGSNDYSNMNGMGDSLNNGNPYNDNNVNNSTDTSTQDASDSSGDVDVLNAFVLLIGGFGIVMGIVLSTYFASIIFDKYCCCCPAFVAVGSLEEVDQGSVARKAGLWGLRLSERQEILKQIFAEKQTVYHARRVVVEQDTPKRNKAEDEKDIEEGNGLRPSKDGDKDTKGDDNADDTKQKYLKEELEDSKDDADHQRACCICLAEYEEGCTLLSGTSCVHKFHYDCSMVWLLRHDECPYCRMLLVSPKAFREAAIALLGEGRIKELADSGAQRTPVVTVVNSVATTPSTASMSIHTNDEIEHVCQETAVVDLETGEHSVDREVEETVAGAAPDGALHAQEEGDIDMKTNPTDDATTEPDLEIGDSNSGTKEEAATSE